MFPRKSGIVLHITSLPGAYGIGDLGASARRFADTLEKMGQTYWQVLPLGPTTYGDSPYQSLSTFAANTLLLSLDLLEEANLLDRDDLDNYPEMNAERVDYGYVIHERTRLYKNVCDLFRERATDALRTRFESFCSEQAYWLDDFALFLALKDAHEGRPWTTWDSHLAHRNGQALAEAREKHETAIDNVRILQFLTFDQWSSLRRYCNDKGIQIIGDIPIFVAHDSADVWANPELFSLDTLGNSSVVAGVPPDYFSETGQLWGNPLYRWDYLEETGYEWWIRRLDRTFEMVDILRIDHFRGFESYWEIPAGETTAINGKWVPGPGMKLFDAFREARGEQPIIAEDLGIITEEVEALREASGFPGMKVLHFSFGDEKSAEPEHQPPQFPANSVCYSGTHDNDTTLGWFTELRANPDATEELGRVLAFLGTEGSEINWDLISAALQSGSNTALFPLQDVLGLGTESRLNFPGKPQGNWQWRFNFNQITDEMIERLKKLTVEAGR